MNVADSPMEKAVTAANTVFPPSVDNSAFVYAHSLASLIIVLCFNIAVGVYMFSEMRKDIDRIPFFSPLTLYRAMIGLAATTGFVRNFPEVVYMLAWAEVSEETMRYIMLGKRMADSIAWLPGSSWQLISLLIYPVIASLLRQHGEDAYATMAPWKRLAWPLVAFIGIVTVACLVAIGKLMMGVPVA